MSSPVELRLSPSRSCSVVFRPWINGYLRGWNGKPSGRVNLALNVIEPWTHWEFSRWTIEFSPASSFVGFQPSKGWMKHQTCRFYYKNGGFKHDRCWYSLLLCEFCTWCDRGDATSEARASMLGESIEIRRWYTTILRSIIRQYPVGCFGTFFCFCQRLGIIIPTD